MFLGIKTVSKSVKPILFYNLI